MRDPAIESNRKQCLMAMINALIVAVCVCVGVTMNLITLFDENFDHMGIRTFCMFTVNSNIFAGLYMLAYLVMVAALGRWEDIYGAMTYLPAWASFLKMLVLGLVIAVVLRLVQNRRARQTRARISRAWDAGMDSVELKIEAFGLGRYMGQNCEGELAVPLDIFTAMSERCGVPLEDLIRAFVRGAADSIRETSTRQNRDSAERRSDI